MRRREFIGAMASAATLPALSGAALRKPILKLGLITDTHVQTNNNNVQKMGEAWKLFRSEGVDLVANVGDIADQFSEKAYSQYSDTVEAAWPRTAADHPREVYVFAFHDYYRYKGDPDRSAPRWKDACEEAAKLLKSPNVLYDSFEMKGYPFVVMTQWSDFKVYEKMVSDAVKSHPGKPVFLFDHVPPFETVYNSRIWGDKQRYDILRKFPSVIDITGHVHQSLRIATSIWQGAFTVVNCGAIATWGGNLVGTAPERKSCYYAVIMDVFPDRLVLRRFDVRTKKELCADDRWVVPLPFAAETAPYSHARMAAAEPVPEFAAGARLTATPDMVPFNTFDLTFPEVRGRGAFEYRIEIARKGGGEWKAYARHDIFTDFWLEDFEKRGPAKHSFPAGFFKTGETVRFSVTPVNAFGKCAKPITVDVAVPEKAQSGELVWKCVNPMAELKCMTGLKDGTQLKLVDGYYEHITHEARLILPNGVWNGSAGTRFRFTIDMRMIQPGGGQWTLVLRNPTPMHNANQRIATPKGDSGLQRYVIEFVKPKDDYDYYFLVREGTPGRIRFESVMIEKISRPS
ncbi:MAG: metallophosphoesterase [Kiritimatiellae bacterium]|nr:metallophosphoesterase [Kiritimatiellia bacterium]